MLKITSVGHSSFLIEKDGEFFLTDPVFSQKILCNARTQPPGIDPALLPPLTAIFVSQACYDHFDLFSYKYFSTEVPIIVPEGLGKLVRRFLKNPVVEIAPWGECSIGKTVVRAFPVHYSGRRFTGFNWRSNSSFLLGEEKETVLFVGDSGYGELFKKIANLHRISVAILPVGGYEPSWWMRRKHMNPVEAIQAFQDLQADWMIPSNWGVFRWSLEGPDEPLKWLNSFLSDQPSEKVKVLQPGEFFEI